MNAPDLVAYLRSLELERGGIRSGEGIVVGLSGGADSVVLLDLLVRLRAEFGLRLVAAHVDHGIRPDSSGDAGFCAELCDKLGVSLMRIRADVPRRAARTGLGIEAAGRAARYTWFEWIRRRHGLDRVATAHHLDDHVETLLMAIGRGSGGRGLRGIAPVNGHLLRPLRGLRRSDLRAHAAEYGLSWREDRSNDDTEHTRNRLRHQVLPVLEAALDRGAFTRIAALSDRVIAETDLLKALVGEKLEQCRLPGDSNTIVLDRQRFDGLSAELRRQIIRLAASGFATKTAHQKWNATHDSHVIEFIKGAHGGQRWTLPGGGLLGIERDRIVLSSGISPDSASTFVDVELELDSKLLPASAQTLNFSGNDEAHFDAEQVHPPFVLRPLLPGDRMQPFGMEGRKKLVTLLSERAIPKERRRHQLVVSDRDRIIWAVGLTTCETARIDERTRQVWRLRVIPAGPVPNAADAS